MKGEHAGPLAGSPASPAAVTGVPLLLLAQAQAAAADELIEITRRLGQTPPALSWIQLEDSRGISIWNYELSLDRGGVTDPAKFFWSAITDTSWGAYRCWCAIWRCGSWTGCCPSSGSQSSRPRCSR